MRKIKFRAWDKKNKKMWAYANPGFPDNKIVNVSQYANGTFNEFLHVHEIELMQYTGLNDKDWKKICEGDIYRDIDDMEFEIRWDNIGCKFIAYCLKEKKRLFLGLDSLKAGIIIGNVYENPEILQDQIMRRISIVNGVFRF